jgi:multisubunit Na+/H+ antiporter MnhE subunit
LTPGTTTVAVSEDQRTLTIHALEAQDEVAVRMGIDRTLRKPMLEFTRPLV